MMSQDNKDESQSSGGGGPMAARPKEQALNCPRCDSPNTKFCYYNNYSLSQPRHFCKTCRRYWTKGGALRNVPIGGGCRKNKKIKTSSSSSRFSGDSKDAISGSSDIGGLKFFHGLSPAMDFQLGGLNFPRLSNTSTSVGGSIFNQYSSFGENSAANIGSSSCFSLDPAGSCSGSLLGFNNNNNNFPFSSSMLKQGTDGVQEMGSMGVHHGTMASSIESLSSINQDLHWKLQQQRLAMLFGGENQKENIVSSSIPLHDDQNQIQIQIQKPQPILFQNLEISSSKQQEDHQEAFGNSNINSRKDCSTTTTNAGSHHGNNLATEWFFDNSFGVNPNSTNSNNGNANDDQNANNWNNTIQAWNNLNQYSALP